MSKLTLPVGERDHIQGPADAAITLVEYGDFECPHCGHAFPIVEEVRRQAGDALRFVFRHFPLTESHAHAEMAAEAAEAAGAHNRFWEMHQTLFTHQSRLEAAQLIRYAGRLGLDTASFEEALRLETFRPRVREDFMSGVRSGVNGTPTFFINGRRYDGPVEAQYLLEAMELRVK